MKDLYPHKISLGTVKVPQWKMAMNSTYGALKAQAPEPAQASLKIEVGDWVKYIWGRDGQFTISEVTSIVPATPQAIDAHPELKDLKLYNLSSGACLAAEAFVDIRKKS